jgi:hypothetical protein
MSEGASTGTSSSTARPARSSRCSTRPVSRTRRASRCSRTATWR